MIDELQSSVSHAQGSEGAVNVQDYLAMVPEGVATFLVAEEGVAKTPTVRSSETCHE
jgi:hypothetical protein